MRPVPSFSAETAWSDWPATRVPFAWTIALWTLPARAAVVSVSAVTADGTWPRVDSLTSVPVSELSLTLAEVTAEALSGLVPTEFLASRR